MKKLISLLSVLAILMTVTFTFSACGHDDEPEPNNPTLIGTWKYVSYSKYQIQGSKETKLYEIYADQDMYHMYMFNEDGTGYITEEEETMKLSWQKIGNKLALFREGGSYSSLTYEIKELTNNTLILSSYGEGEEDDDYDYRYEEKYEKL